jgi:DNA-binding MarR family transcriptional regulator
MKVRNSDLQLFHRLRRVSMALERSRAEFARLHGLHPTDVRALVTLLDAGRTGERVTPGWLGRKLGLNSAGTTTLVDRLERSGYVDRVRGSQDRRQVILEVTCKAVDLGWSFFGPMIEAAAERMHAFGPEEIAIVERFLDAIGSVAEDELRPETTTASKWGVTRL